MPSGNHMRCWACGGITGKHVSVSGQHVLHLKPIPRCMLSLQSLTWKRGTGDRQQRCQPLGTGESSLQLAGRGKSRSHTGVHPTPGRQDHLRAERAALPRPRGQGLSVAEARLDQNNRTPSTPKPRQHRVHGTQATRDRPAEGKA